MYASVRTAFKKLQRDRKQLSARVLARKAWDYAQGIVLARLALASVDEVGEGVRTLGWPRIENFGHMTIGKHTSLRSVNVPLELCTGQGATLQIGRQCSLNYGVSIGATGSITIGHRTRLGPYVMVVDTDFHDALRRGLRPAPRPVHIGDDVWIGAKASILPGVRIGRGAIVGTGAVVTSDVPEFAVVAGVPARVLHTLDASKFEPEKDF